MSELLTKAKQLQQAAKTLALLSTEEKNEALMRIADAITKQKDWILQENEKDVALGKEQGLSPALIDRLQLTGERIEQMVGGVRQVAGLPDPIGEIVEEWTRPNGLRIQTVRVPLGVIGMVYEARPNVTVDATSLCLKTGMPSYCVEVHPRFIQTKRSSILCKRRCAIPPFLPMPSSFLKTRAVRQPSKCSV